MMVVMVVGIRETASAAGAGLHAGQRFFRSWTGRRRRQFWALKLDSHGVVARVRVGRTTRKEKRQKTGGGGDGDDTAMSTFADFA